jgi:hypothetical protein
MSKLTELANEYKEITGEDVYLYTSRPGDGQVRCAFQAGVVHGTRRAEKYLTALLEAVRAGKDHSQAQREVPLPR